MKESKLWILHLFSGLALVFLLLSHIALMHYGVLLNKIGMAPEDVLAWQAVFERAQSLSFKVVYILFLLFALYHGLYGLRNIILETSWGQKIARALTFALLIIGIAFFIYGTLTTLFIPA